MRRVRRARDSSLARSKLRSVMVYSPWSGFGKWRRTRPRGLCQCYRGSGRAAARATPRDADPRRGIAPAPKPGTEPRGTPGARGTAVGLDQQPLPGTSARPARGLFPPRNTRPLKRDGQPELQRGLGVVDGPEKECSTAGGRSRRRARAAAPPKTGRSPAPTGAHPARHGARRGTAVQDRRLGRVESQAQVAPQVASCASGGMMRASKSRPVSAYRHGTLIGGQADDLRPIRPPEQAEASCGWTLRPRRSGDRPAPSPAPERTTGVPAWHEADVDAGLGKQPR